MLAAPPDRIRGWQALLDGFGIAKEPALFGKMLKRAPFMFYVNPPRIGDEDLSHVVDSDVSTTASGFVAYGALKVLQLLRAQNFPDLDKIVRTQPSILLVPTTEVSARANFLVNLFLENMPSIADAAANNAYPNSADDSIDIYLDEVKNALSKGPKVIKNKMKSNIASSQVVFATLPTQQSQLTQLTQSTQPSFDKRILLNSEVLGNLRAWESEVNNDQLGSYSEISSQLSQNQHLAHDMLGALLLTYPAVLSINHQ